MKGMTENQWSAPDPAAPVSPPAHPAVSVHHAMDTARGAGSWLPWTGLVLAVCWWACVAVSLVTVLDLDAIMRQPPVTLAAGALLALMPGMLLLMAGFMARESARAGAANALVLQAADQLLSPAARIGEHANTLAGQLAASTEEINQAMNRALSSMKAMAGEIGDERMRLESVSYATADNARELSTQLTREREALESLARELKAQGEAVAQAIPRQAEAMVDASRQAGEDIRRADDALDGRLQHLQATRGEIGRQLQQLEQITASAGEKSEGLMFAIARIQEKLEQSEQMVKAAVRSGEVAAAAAGSTGDALRAAVDTALDGARRASQDIEASTRAAQAETARALDGLHRKAEDVAAAIRAAGMAARAETDITEQRLAKVSSAFRSAVSGPPDSQPQRAADTTQAASRSAEAADPPPEALPISGERKPGISGAIDAPPRQVDEDLFETLSRDRAAHAEDEARGEEIAIGWPRKSGNAPGSFSEIFDPDPAATSGPAAPAPGFGPTEAPDPSNVVRMSRAPVGETPPINKDAGWTSILSDMDRSAAGQLPREDTAEEVISRLETSGIALASIFRPRDKKKIALASRKGERLRRAAILSAAKGEVDRVEKRLKADDYLCQLAMDFHAMEEPDAIAALDRTQKSSRNASPRLSAFLLLDAALSEERMQDFG